MPRSDRFAIAARVRALVGGEAGGNVSALAHRLGVDELALRMTTNERSPHPVLDVLAAIVDEYGVDPTWLVTGEYDSATHRQALDVDPASVIVVLRRLFESETPELPISDRNQLAR